MKVALLQLNPTVGDLSGNAELLLGALARAEEQGADLAVAPELALTGYPPRDLLERPSFVRAVEEANDRVVARSSNVPLVFGSVGRHEGRLQNQALAVQGGQLLGRAAKQLLPNYDVFDEQRYFQPGSELLTLLLAGRRCALSICEDAWGAAEEARGRYAADPFRGLPASGAEVLLNLSASPFTLPKRHIRERIFADTARRFGLPVVMVNQVGGNDELLFDGASSVFGRDGQVLARAKAFEEDLLLAGLGAAGRVEAAPESDEAAACRALTLGIADYARKCRFSRAVLGLSGGIDSALVATLAADALGPSNVLGVAMPSRYSSAGSLDDAQALAANLGIGFRTISIDPMFQSYIDQLQAPLDELWPPGSTDVTWENVQARIRGALIMALSNRTGALPLTTGNKSELAVGYCTLYGDMVGGLSAISDVPKTMVYRLAHWLNRNGERIPQNSISKAPSAELRPNQTDQDSLPPYDVLDAILERYVEQQQSPEEIVAAGFPRETVARVHQLLVASEYKRRQAAPGLILTRKAFGLGRRVPVAQAFGRSEALLGR
jgi:NAD+ synthase (glutamine-hydrolysing)